MADTTDRSSHGDYVPDGGEFAAQRAVVARVARGRRGRCASRPSTCRSPPSGTTTPTSGSGPGCRSSGSPTT